MRILLVEDDPWMCNALQYHLKKEHYAVDTAQDGETALELGLSAEYDMAILDRMLPKLDGLTVLKRLRAAGKSWPVLFLTAMDEVCDRVDGLDAGADDYLVKPFATQELMARVRAMARRAGEALREDCLRFDDVALYPRSGTVRRGDREMSLTPKETLLLELLARNRGQVIPRGLILDKVWGTLDSVEPGNVDSYIHFLRGKLAQLGSQWRIATVRGLGFRLERPEKE